MLTAATEHYNIVQKLVAAAILGARRRRLSISELATFITVMQIAAAQQGADSIAEMAREQKLDPEATQQVIAALFGGTTQDGTPLTDVLLKVLQDESPHSLDQMVWTLIADAARGGQQAASVATPSVVGHIRLLTPPSCARCAILAGRVYRLSDGFPRHPQCDCVMIPVGKTIPDGLIDSPVTAFQEGHITGKDMSLADRAAIQAAIDSGADEADVIRTMGQVVNIRLRSAGLTRAGRVLKRGSRLTPEGIFALTDDRDEITSLLISSGYLR